MATPQFTGLQIIPNLIQGVSQQAAQSRRDAQCEAQFDCVNSTLEGVAARPHAELVKLWPARNWAESLFSETNHDVDENYLTGVDEAGNPFAVDLADGTDCTVNIEAPSLSYLQFAASVSSKDKLRAQVVDDTTFICNRRQKPLMNSLVSADKRNEALVFVRATAFNTTYKITLTIGAASLVASVGPTSNTNTKPTDEIAEELQAQISGVNGYSCSRSGSVLKIWRSTNTGFDIETTDGNGDDYMRAFYGEASKFSQLPARGFPGMIIKVKGTDSASDDDYYVKFVGEPATGNWQETVGPGTSTTLNPATMPHTLVCTNFRTFEFRRVDYSTRIVGDSKTAKDPGFVGKYIRDMIYHQRRLCIIHTGGAVFSKTDNPYTFFPDTVQTVLATAPVDIKISSGDKRGAAILDYGLQAQENLFLWAQRVQFRVSSGNEAFKQDTVEVNPSMAYQYAQGAYPLPVQSFVFLASDLGQFASLRALQFAQTKLAGDVDVTSHVGQYIASGVSGLDASDTLRYIFVRSDGDQRSLYLFNYTYDGNEGFIQAAFNTWRIPGGDILWAGVKDNFLRVMQQRPDGVAYLRFDLTPQVIDPQIGAKYSIRLDLRVSEASVSGLTYDPVADASSFNVPYRPRGPDFLVVTSADKAGGYTRGRVFKTLSVVNTTVTVKGDLRGYSFYAGHRITSVRRESQFFVRTDKGAQPTDRLHINRFFLTLAQSAYTRVEVAVPNKATKSYEFPLRKLGSPSAVIGTPIPLNGKIDAPVAENAEQASITLINDTFLPSYWQSAAYDYTAVGWAGGK